MIDVGNDAEISDALLVAQRMASFVGNVTVVLVIQRFSTASSASRLYNFVVL